MAYEHDGLAIPVFRKTAEYDRLVQAIEVTRGFVEQDEGRVVEQHSRQSKPLALAAGKAASSIADGRIDALGQVLDEVC